MLNYHLTAELARHRHAQLLAEADRERLARATRSVLGREVHP
jgi:hypothetical protein